MAFKSIGRRKWLFSVLMLANSLIAGLSTASEFGEVSETWIREDDPTICFQVRGSRFVLATFRQDSEGESKGFINGRLDTTTSPNYEFLEVDAAGNIVEGKFNRSDRRLELKIRIPHPSRGLGYAYKGEEDKYGKYQISRGECTGETAGAAKLLWKAEPYVFEDECFRRVPNWRDVDLLNRKESPCR